MEDWILWFTLAAAVAVSLIGLNIFRKYSQSSGSKTETQEPRPPQRPQGAGGNRRAGVAARNRRGARRVEDSDSDGGAPAAPARPQVAGAAAAAPAHADGSDDDDFPGDSAKLAGMGAKKRAKMEAKEEKRQQRETEERLREEKKKKEAAEDEERKKREQQEEEEERRQIEEAKRLREEQLKREQEEYLKMKAAFTVEDEGCDVHESDEEEDLLGKFIEHIKEKKVILFEELATHFGLKVPAAIDRLNTLVAEGRLTGVMDDRGKFIYISEEELNKFAKFIKQRGRVSISDLVESSSSIINISQDSKAATAVEG